MVLQSSGTTCAVRGCTSNQIKLNQWQHEHGPKTTKVPMKSCIVSFAYLEMGSHERMWLKGWNLMRLPKFVMFAYFAVEKRPMEENLHPVLWLEQTPANHRRKYAGSSEGGKQCNENIGYDFKHVKSKALFVWL